MCTPIWDFKKLFGCSLIVYEIIENLHPPDFFLFKFEMLHLFDEVYVTVL